MGQMCKHSLDCWSLRWLFLPTFLHQLPSSASKPDMFCVIRFSRACPIQHAGHKFKHRPELLVIERVKAGEYLVYHHSQSVHIGRLRGSATRFPEPLGIQQLWGHVEGRATSGDRSHLFRSTRGEGRKPKVGEASSSWRFVGN